MTASQNVKAPSTFPEFQSAISLAQNFRELSDLTRSSELPPRCLKI